jgi:hypothetical protein
LDRPISTDCGGGSAAGAVFLIDGEAVACDGRWTAGVRPHALSAAGRTGKSPKNICKHFDDCLQRSSYPNKDADGIRAGVKARNGQIVLAGAEACARDLGKKQQWDKWARGVQNSNLSKLLRWDWNSEKPIVLTIASFSSGIGGVEWAMTLWLFCSCSQS